LPEQTHLSVEHVEYLMDAAPGSTWPEADVERLALALEKLGAGSPDLGLDDRDDVDAGQAGKAADDSSGVILKPTSARWSASTTAAMISNRREPRRNRT
jgi:hypothetical protein